MLLEPTATPHPEVISLALLVVIFSHFQSYSKLTKYLSKRTEDDLPLIPSEEPYSHHHHQGEKVVAIIY